jgi:hypothetical protein
MSDSSSAQIELSTDSYCLPDHDPDKFAKPPTITSFTAKGAVALGFVMALQVEKGKPVEMSWAIEGEVTGLEMDGANRSFEKSVTTFTVTPTEDTAYVLKAKNENGWNSATLMVSLHESHEAVAQATSVASQGLRVGPIAVSNDQGDVYMDPPVRLLRQWDSGRWGPTQIAGDNPKATWTMSGCGPTSTAMVLRWFAEDCPAGHVPFPTKKNGAKIKPDWYPPRMGEYFWPNANPPGKIALTASHTLDNDCLFGLAAHWLKSGGQGDPLARGAYHPKSVSLSEIKSMLTMGPVILGIGDPAPVGHFVVVQGFASDALLIVDPGKVIYSAVRKGGVPGTGGGAAVIENWKGIQGYKDGEDSGNARHCRVPQPSQWKDGNGVDGKDWDPGCYCALSGAALERLMKFARNAASLSYPEGPLLASVGGVVPPPQAAPYSPKSPPSNKPPAGSDAMPTPMTNKLDAFFTYNGQVGESERPTPHVYRGYQQEHAFATQGKKTPWFLKGRLQIDMDGAPNCYDPHDKNVLPTAKLKEFETWKGALDWMKNGGHEGNWFGCLTDTQEVTGKRVFQKEGDPFPGFCISTTSLVDKSKKSHDPKRYTDSSKIPYIAFPKQIWNEGKTGSLFKKVGQGSTGNLGDYVTIFNMKDGSSIAHAIIADIGDKPHFGEVALATAKQLNDFSGVVSASMLYIVYPGSGAGQGTIPTFDQIMSTGKSLFDKFGGLDEVKRVLALME